MMNKEVAIFKAAEFIRLGGKIEIPTIQIDCGNLDCATCPFNDTKCLEDEVIINLPVSKLFTQYLETNYPELLL